MEFLNEKQLQQKYSIFAFALYIIIYLTIQTHIFND